MTGPLTTFAATDPGLGAATIFSVVAQTAITGTGTISGDVGINSTGAGITALIAGNVGGAIYSTDGVAPSTAILAPAVQANLSTANGNISGQGSTASIGPVLDGETLTAGIYDIGAGRLNGGILTLNGPGIYIFRASSDLVSSGSINLTNGARACDVYWQVNTLATINGSSFVGTIIAGTGVHFGANVVLDGRALALGGDVTLLNNTISGPTCATPLPAPATLHVVKTVINDNGGTAVASDFILNVTGTNVSNPSFAGSESGVDVTLDAGAYAVTETGLSGYLQSGSDDCSGTIAAGETKTCTITNDDIVPEAEAEVEAEVEVEAELESKPITGKALNVPEEIAEEEVAPEILVEENVVPKLPNTGIGSDEKSIPWNIIVPAGILAILTSLYFARRKQTA